MIQVVSVTYQGSKSWVVERSGWYPVQEFPAALEEARTTNIYSAIYSSFKQ